MIYKYFCSCGKEFVVDHQPGQVLETCNQVKPDCEDNFFLVREDYVAAMREENDKIKSELKHYATDDQEVLRERLKHHAEELEYDLKQQEEEAKKNSISVDDLIDRFRNRE